MAYLQLGAFGVFSAQVLCLLDLWDDPRSLSHCSPLLLLGYHLEQSAEPLE